VSAGERASLTLDAEPGATVVIRYLGPGSAAHYRLWVAGVLVGMDGAERGTRTQATVPPGALRAECYERIGAEPEVRELQLAAGERTELVFGERE
jgi:hypothetical protein